MRAIAKLTSIAITALALTACAETNHFPAVVGVNATAPICVTPPGGLPFVPTATPLPRPVLNPTATPYNATAAPPTTTSEPVVYCTPAALVTPVPTATPYTGFAAGDVRNLTMDITSQKVEAVASHAAYSALTWKQDGQIILATSKGGSAFTATNLGAGQNSHLAFSAAGRLHIAYEKHGNIYYLNLEPAQIQQPTLPQAQFVAAGSAADLVVDSGGWANLFYKANGRIYHRRQRPLQWQAPIPIAPGFHVSAVSLNGSLYAVIRNQKRIAIYRTSINPTIQWKSISAPIAAPAGTMIGTPHLAAAADDDTTWLYTAFVAKQPLASGDNWAIHRPEYKPAGQYAYRVHSGTNAQQWFTVFSLHNAGVYQQVPVTGAALTLSAWGEAWAYGNDCSFTPLHSCGNQNMNMQIGIDPTGGLAPDSPNVVWSAAQTPLDAYRPFAVSAPAAGPIATVYLRARPQWPLAGSNVYWDGATLTGGRLTNGDFEGAFPPYNGIGPLAVAAGWHPFYQERPISDDAAAIYTIYAAWSRDDGQTWMGPKGIGQNKRDGAYEGIFDGDVFPFLNLDDKQTIFVFNYQEGDPPEWQPQAIRYGRPRTIACDIEHADDCTGSPGVALAPPTQPAYHVRAAVSLYGHNGIIAWDSLQADDKKRDVFATSFSPRVKERQ